MPISKPSMSINILESNPTALSVSLKTRELSIGRCGDEVLKLKVQFYLLGAEDVLANETSQGSSPVQKCSAKTLDTFDEKIAAAVRNIQGTIYLPATGIVDDATALGIDCALEESGRCAMYGFVTMPDGRPAKGVHLVADHQGVGDPQTLGKAIASKAGYYLLTYKWDPESPSRPDVVVRASDPDGGKELLLHPTLIDAPCIYKLDLKLQSFPTKALREYN